MSVRSLALVAACGGCNLVWGVTTQTDRDATIAVDATPMCLASLPQEDFTIAPICGGIGVPISKAADSLDGGDLVITLVANAITFAGCIGQTLPAFRGSGLFAHVRQIAVGPDEYNVLSAHWDDGVNATEIFASPAGIELAHGIQGGATVTYGTAPLAPWWRIRPSDDGQTIVGEWSTDGIAWTSFGTDPVAPPPRIQIELGIGSFRADTEPSVARVASIDVCP